MTVGVLEDVLAKWFTLRSKRDAFPQKARNVAAILTPRTPFGMTFFWCGDVGSLGFGILQTFGGFDDGY
jgi:hypothetical protein